MIYEYMKIVWILASLDLLFFSPQILPTRGRPFPPSLWSFLLKPETRKHTKKTQKQKGYEHPPTTLFSGGGGMMQPWCDCLTDSFS